MMECKLYKSFSELPDYYQMLFESNFNDNYYSSADWFNTLYNTTRIPGEELLIFGVEEEDKALGILFMLQRKRRYGPFTVKQISSLTNIYSVTFSPLLNSAHRSEAEIIEKLIATLQSSPQKWDVIAFENIEYNSLFFEIFYQQFISSKYITQKYFCHKNWFERTRNEDFDAYLCKRKSKVKSNHRRRLKKINNELGKPEFRLYSDFENLEYAIQEFNSIYALSWKGEEQHPKFIEEIIKNAAAKKILRLGLYSANGKTLAAKLTFATKTTGHMYKTAYDPKYGKYGAGTAINMFMIEHLLNVDKVELLDFGIGNEHYKSELMDSSRERWGITAYNNHSIVGMVIGNYYLTGRYIKKYLAHILSFSKKTLFPEKTKEHSSKQQQTSNGHKYELTSFDSVTKLPAKIKSALSQISKTSFFKGYSWFELLEKHSLSKNQTVKIYILQDRFNMTPLMVYPILVEQRKTLLGMNTVLTDFSTLYGIEFSPIILEKNQNEDDLLTNFFSKLKKDIKWDVFNIGLLYDHKGKMGTPFQKHISACEKNFSLFDKYYHSMNWHAYIKKGDFSKYLKERPKKLQNTLQRKNNKLRKNASSEIIIYNNEENIEKAILDYQEIYQSSWKDVEYSQSFIHNFIRKAAHLNILRLGILYIDSKPASFVKILLSDNKAVIYKLAYSPKFHDFSPGSILLYEMIKHVVEQDGIEYIDFGVGDDPFKKDWMHIKSQIYGIIIFNKKSVFGLFNALKHFSGKILKRKSKDKNIE